MKNIQDNSFFSKAYNPVLQAGAVLAMVFFMMVMGNLLKALNIITIRETFPWLVAAAFMLFFAVFNSVFSLSAGDLNKYWTKSMLCFAGLAIASGLLAYLFSSIAISEARSYPWIYFVVTFGYLVFLSMMGFVKKIVNFAQHEEWQKPRRKSRARKRK